MESYWTRARTSRRRLIGAAAGTAAVGLLASCGSKPRSSTNSSTSASSKPKSGGTLVGNTVVDPFDWDQTYLGSDIPNDLESTFIYDSLLTFKTGPAVKFTELALAPSVAVKWETPDPQTYIFHTRPGLKWANLPPVNGRDLTSADVKWSYEYETRTGQFADKKLAQAQYDSFFEGMLGIDTPDASTVALHFKEPFVPFLNYTASHHLPILAHEIYDLDGHFKNRAVGTGPWQLDTASSQKGTHWLFKRNPTYWDTGKPYIDAINMLIIQDDATAYAAFETRQVDILTGGLGAGGGNGRSVTPDDAARIKKAAPDASVLSNVKPSPDHLYMQVQRPPLSDLRIRKAISLGMDRDEFVKVMTSGKGSWALAGAFPDTFSDAEIHQMLKFDPEQAKQLVVQAGYANGVDVEFIYPGESRGQAKITEMELFQAQMKKIGINLVLKSFDKGTWGDLKKQRNFSMDISSKKVEGDVDSYVYAIFYPTSKLNYGAVDDPQLTPLLEAQRREIDPAKRRDIVRQAVTRINVDQVWALAVYNDVDNEIWQPYVKNLTLNFGGGVGPLTNAWLDK